MEMSYVEQKYLDVKYLTFKLRPLGYHWFCVYKFLNTPRVVWALPQDRLYDYSTRPASYTIEKGKPIYYVEKDSKRYEVDLCK